MAQSKYDKAAFQKTFNDAFGDTNIYYSDPDRANVSILGWRGHSQSRAVLGLRRNEVLTVGYPLKICEQAGQLDYLLQHSEEETAEDLRSYSDTAQAAMKGYLEVVPPGEIEQARKLIAQ